MTGDVLLGYAVGTGEAVSVPIAHMVVTGQTQASGKTTTLEALVSRAVGMRAMAFLTKRGEGAFGGPSRIIPPYFRERADWQFVSAILEAETRERMKFERSWIMRATRGAKTLQDVRDNITKLQRKATRSMDNDMFMMLAAYLDAVLPVLARVRFATTVKLGPGLNVVDLTNVPVNVQGLVIASMLAWVHEHESDVTTILPESWKFIPQGRNSPVKLAATAIAREGAAIGNLLWLDSQDIAGAEKEIVRQASVWLLGVQREEHEIKRALGQVGHGIKKPRAQDVATLQRGQFYACWGQHAVKTYVRPSWMSDDDARSIATGRTSVDSYPGVKQALHRTAHSVTDVDPYRSPPLPALAYPDLDAPAERCETRTDTAIGGQVQCTGDADHQRGKHTYPPGIKLRHPERNHHQETDDMTPAQEQKIDKVIDGIADLTKLMRYKIDSSAPPDADAPTRPAVVPDDLDSLVDAVLARIGDRAPKVLRILATKPELQVEDKIETITVDGKTLRGRLAKMIVGGWFAEWVSGTATHKELQQQGFSTAAPNVYRDLDALCEMGFLRKQERQGFKAVEDMKVNVIRGK